MNWDECPLGQNDNIVYDSFKRQGHAPWSIFVEFQSSANPSQLVVCTGKHNFKLI